MKKLPDLYNFLLGEYHYFKRHMVLKNKPRVWFIETTNYCNLSCPMCPRNLMTRKVGFMEFGLFKKVVQQIKGATSFTWLHSFGEPLFHPELGLFIDYCSANNIKTGISTNATILDADKSKMLLDSSLHRIILCMDGATSDTYAKLRFGADFIKTKENILNFLRLAKERKKKDLIVEVQIINMRNTSSEIELFTREWSAIGARVVVKVFTTWGNQVNSIVDTYSPRILYTHRKKERYPCKFLWTEGGVLWNGDFVVCCMDFNGHTVAGNLSTDTLKDIWNSSVLIGLRKEQSEDNYTNPLCKNCTEWPGSAKDRHYLIPKIYSKILSKYQRSILVRR
jgi:MoaA/NifB/PqqE/SkfB family radical SAM enzyme